MDQNKLPHQWLRPLLVNPDWKLMEEYLADLKNRLVIQLCNCNETQLKDLQGQLKTIEVILALKGKLKTD